MLHKDGDNVCLPYCCIFTVQPNSWLSSLYPWPSKILGGSWAECLACRRHKLTSGLGWDRSLHKAHGAKSLEFWEVERRPGPCGCWLKCAENTWRWHRNGQQPEQGGWTGQRGKWILFEIQWESYVCYSAVEFGLYVWRISWCEVVGGLWTAAMGGWRLVRRWGCGPAREQQRREIRRGWSIFWKESRWDLLRIKRKVEKNQGCCQDCWLKIYKRSVSRERQTRVRDGSSWAGTQSLKVINNPCSSIAMG